MGLRPAYDKEDRDGMGREYRYREIVKTCMGCLVSLLTSMMGGLILAWWEWNYHPTNSQLWMVPSGLILLVTPLTVSFSACLSDCFSPKESAASSLNEPVMSLDNT